MTERQISPASYFAEMLILLQKNNGVLETNQLYKLIQKSFKREMTEIDLQEIEGKSIPLWKNQVDFAKAQGTRQHITRTITLFNKQKYVVLLDADITAPVWLHICLQQKTSKSHFKKRCNRCKSYNALSADICICGRKFPAVRKTRKVELQKSHSPTLY